MTTKIACIALVIAIIVLACFTVDFQMQTMQLQTQAASLQAQLANYRNLTTTLQTQINTTQAQINELQNSSYQVSFENIDQTPFYPIVGLTLEKTISFTLRNVGSKDIGGLTFEFKILDNGTVWNGDYELGGVFPEQLGVLHAGESAVIKVVILTSVDVSFSGKNFVITALLDKTVLGQQAVSLD